MITKFVHWAAWRLLGWPTVVVEDGDDERIAFFAQESINGDYIIRRNSEPMKLHPDGKMDGYARRWLPAYPGPGIKWLGYPQGKRRLKDFEAYANKRLLLGGGEHDDN